MKKLLSFLITLMLCINILAQTTNLKIKKFQQINPSAVELIKEDNSRITIDFYGENIFRLFEDVNGGFIRDPEAKSKAEILVKNPRKPLSRLDVSDENGSIKISTAAIEIIFNKDKSTFQITRLDDNKIVVEETESPKFEENRVSLTLRESPDEYFYGGGVQNGRFSHKSKIISIENQNSWTDGGVASPAPYFWSTNGYGFMWYTFKKGKYDFGSTETGKVKLYHETNYLDVFFMISNTASALLNDYYQLTGNPVLLPKFGFYEGHLNAYNRDYWTETETGGILFEDGKRYRESSKNKEGIKESLNGEKDNYQFSARAVIDRYKAHDMPLGWILPNDGYGAGYGQTETLDGNILNLKELGDYARKHGVEIGLWTQSDLHPKEGVPALLQRDIIKEVRDAGVRVLKTDVAWVGAGYSFGLSGISDVAGIMQYYGNDSRPFIISLDGWAGTQRYAGIWSGDQTGGLWEYIRFHIPTYICAGLSGIPNISSDMDGIFGGRNTIVNVRDFEWKAFSPMQLNMDGWGANEKYPHALGEPAASINRWYLKLKTQMMPYTYSIAHESVDGLPMLRAMFLEYPNDYTHNIYTQYQYMYGPYILVAPVYQATATSENGDDIRNGIYLPEGRWIDYFSGEEYEGNRILNNFDAPLWKLPLFVKAGAIIPMTNSNNNVSEIRKDLRIYEIYPYGDSDFTEYDDDGYTEAYKNGEFSTTHITSSLSDHNLNIEIHPTEGNFTGFEKHKTTIFKIIAENTFKKIYAKIGDQKISLRKAESLNDFENSENVYFHTEALNGNPVKIDKKAILIKLAETDVSKSGISLNIKGIVINRSNSLTHTAGTLAVPGNFGVDEADRMAYSLKPRWDKIANADFYEIEFNNMLYSSIKDNFLLFDNLTYETDYSFKLRAANKDGYSDWTTLNCKTKPDPLEFAIHGITATTSVKNQRGHYINKMFNFDEGDTWHTAYGEKAVPFEMIIDLNSINTIERLEYLPRNDAGNGTIMNGSISYSYDRENWTDAGTFSWERNTDAKTFHFTDKPAVRYIRISVSKGTGDFGSGREMYIFKVPGTPSYRPGDINNDRLLDMNDFTSYLNYTGLRLGDADFEGYISNGDLNKNGLIDAYDISVLATKLRGGAKSSGNDIDGNIILSTNKQTYNAGETIEINVKVENPRNINALSFALPYPQDDVNYIGLDKINMKGMENMTNDRLHTNGSKVLYPTFVNIGDKDCIDAEGTVDMFIIKFKANRKLKLDIKAVDGIIVNKNLNTKHLTF